MRKCSIVLAVLFAVSISLLAGCTGDPQVIDPTQTGAGATGSVVTVQPSQGAPSGGGGGTSYVPSIKDFDDNIEIGGNYDFSTTYDYTNALSTLTLRNGTASTSGGVYSMTSNGSLYACTDNAFKFPYGTISADVINNGADAGIIFGLSASSDRFFDGGSGASYYFYFVSMNGYAYLGRTTTSNAWQALVTTTISGYSASTKYNIKAVFRGNKIICYLNNEVVFTYADSTPLTGTGWGLRSNNGTNSTISNLTLSSSIEL